jgi:predicted solute-binding protein
LVLATENVHAFWNVHAKILYYKKRKLRNVHRSWLFWHVHSVTVPVIYEYFQSYINSI